MGGGNPQDCRGEGGAIYIPECAHAPDFLLTNPACPNNGYTICQIRANVTQWLGIPPVPWGQCTTPKSSSSLAAEATNIRAYGPSPVVGKAKGKQYAEVVGDNPACTSLFEVEVKSTRSVIKSGDFVKVRTTTITRCEAGSQAVHITAWRSQYAYVLFTTIKCGQVKFDVRVANPSVNETLLAGVQYPASDRVFFAKGAMMPRRKDAPIVPNDLDLHEIKGIYWNRVPLFKQDSINRRWGARTSHSFTAKFLISPLYKSGEAVELYPGACLLNHPDGMPYCCQAATVKVCMHFF